MSNPLSLTEQTTGVFSTSGNQLRALLEPVTYFSHQLSLPDRVKKHLLASCVSCHKRLEAFLDQPVCQLSCGHIMDRNCYKYNPFGTRITCPLGCRKNDHDYDTQFDSLQALIEKTPRHCLQQGCMYVAAKSDLSYKKTCPYPMRTIPNVTAGAGRFLHEHGSLILAFITETLNSQHCSLEEYCIEGISQAKRSELRSHYG